MTYYSLINPQREAKTSRLLRERAAASPEAVIATFKSDVILAGELNLLADDVAWALVDALGDGPDCVAYVGNDLLTAMVGQLAIDRAGKIAVAIPYDEIPERFAHIVAESNCRLLLVDQPLNQFSFITQLSWRGHPRRQGPPPVSNYPHLTGYAFTSGSTGVPKGIMYSRDNGEYVDVNVAGLGPQVFGRSLAGLSSADIGSVGSAIRSGNFHYFDFRGRGIRELAPWIREKGITHFSGTPTLIRMLCDAQPDPADLASLKILHMVGEPLTWDDVDKVRPYFPPTMVFSQGYGSTDVSYIGRFSVSLSDPSKTGPLPITELYEGVTLELLDEARNPVPDGEIGEIVVSGVHLPLGYLNRPDLDAELRETLPNGVTRGFTRDGAVRQPDGSLLLKGRLDHMVKIAGNRIELGEVEVGLRRLPGVNQAVASTYVDGAGDLRLCAYVTATVGDELDGGALRTLLRRQMPAIMVPDGVVVLEQLPIMATGKIDRQSLPPFTDFNQTPATQHEDPFVESLRDVMASVLSLPSFGATDNYFDVGGDSIRASRLFGEIKNRLGIDAPISTLYEAQTAVALAALLRGDKSADHNMVIPIRPEGADAPLFCVHGGGGEVVWAYNFLTALPSSTPVYGFQPSHLELAGLVAPPVTVQEYANRYIEEMLKLQPHGPYHLYGYSLGGLIAFEMALELQRRGLEVAFLGIGDTGFQPHQRKSRYAPPPLFPLRRHISFWRWCFDDQRLWRRVDADRARGIPVEQSLRTKYFMRAHGEGLSYTPSGVYDGDVTFLKAMAEDVAVPPVDHVRGQVTIVPLPYRHLDLVQPDPSESIARAIAAAIGDTRD